MNGALRLLLAGAFCVVLAASGTMRAASLQTAARGMPATAPYRALLDQYCVTCHNQRQRTAGLMLDTLDVDNISDAAEVWEKVVRKLRTGAMPPAGVPRPDKPAADAFVMALETALDRASAVTPNPGRPSIHRLNRTEYANAIRDLLGVEIDVRAFLSPDDSDHGFDNIADVLSVSPVRLDEYMSAARRVSRLAVGDPATGPALEAKTYELPPLLFQDDQMSEDFSFGTRGGLAVRHYFPLDGEYLLTIRLRRTVYGYLRGVAEAHELEVRVDGKRIKTFTVGAHDKGKPSPVSFSGNYLPGDPAWEEYMLSGDAGLEVRFPAKAGTRKVVVAFVKKPSVEAEGVLRPPLTDFGYQINESRSSPSSIAAPAVENISISGPYNAGTRGNTPSRRRIFVCHPGGSGTTKSGQARDEVSCAREILSAIARRAYRRPVTERDVETLLGFFGRERQAGDFDAAIQFALERILADPEFWFRIERDPTNVAPGTPYRLNDIALASRLSFFLWSSIPDDELLAVAVRGDLKAPPVLERQVRRMLADARSNALVDSFATQWLSLRQLESVAPDREAYPEFDDNLREALRRETELFVQSQLREDRSVVDLLTANYTFVNERLARHYGIPDVHGSQFRRVALGKTRRGGLLGHGSILTVTSYPTRTSPVLRGHWLMENILGTPPPPPPPDVPALTENSEGKPQSMRERMEQHRRNPVCATCHVRMDPLGFALEHFDAIGKLRIDDAGAPIDASGAFPDGTRFEGLEGLQKLLLNQREEFVSTVTEKLLTYALGRSVAYFDRPAIRKIVRDAATDDYRWSSIILGIVRSTPFRMKRSAS